MTSPRAILALRFSSIGDIVQTTSPINTLRKLFSDSRIDFMTLSKFSPLLEGHPSIDRTISLDINSGPFELIKTGRYLEKQGYDIVIDFHNTLRSKLICSSIKNIPVFSLKKPRWRRFKLFMFHKNGFSNHFNVRTWLHEPIQKWLDSHSTPSPTSLSVSEIELIEAKSSIISKGIVGKYFVITPGAAWAQKRWSGLKYAEVIDLCKEKWGLDAVLLGGVNDHICDEIVESSNVNVVDFHGGTNLRESLAIVANAEFVLGSDTGFLHAGEALGVPAVTILGPTSKETGAGVFLEKSQIVSLENLWCRPCSQNGSFPCYRKKQYCMTEISTSQVLRKILPLASA